MTLGPSELDRVHRPPIARESSALRAVDAVVILQPTDVARGARTPGGRVLAGVADVDRERMARLRGGAASAIWRCACARWRRGAGNARAALARAGGEGTWSGHGVALRAAAEGLQASLACGRSSARRAAPSRWCASCRRRYDAAVDSLATRAVPSWWRRARPTHRRLRPAGASLYRVRVPRDARAREGRATRSTAHLRLAAAVVATRTARPRVAVSNPREHGRRLCSPRRASAILHHHRPRGRRHLGHQDWPPRTPPRWRAA
jgi:hypothetical protein